jgi:hypothetical protein
MEQRDLGEIAAEQRPHRRLEQHASGTRRHVASVQPRANGPGVPRLGPLSIPGRIDRNLPRHRVEAGDRLTGTQQPQRVDARHVAPVTPHVPAGDQDGVPGGVGGGRRDGHSLGQSTEAVVLRPDERAAHVDGYTSGTPPGPDSSAHPITGLDHRHRESTLHQPPGSCEPREPCRYHTDVRLDSSVLHAGSPPRSVRPPARERQGDRFHRSERPTASTASSAPRMANTTVISRSSFCSSTRLGR